MIVKYSDRFAGFMAGLHGSNGSAGPPSASLALLRERVATAEKNLQDARSAMRGAAEKLGIPRGGLFAESLFVSRATAEKWHDQGCEEGRAEMLAGFRLALQPPTPEEKALGDAVRLALSRGELRFGVASSDEEAAAADLAQKEAAAADLAQKILAAGERARSDGSHERPHPTGLAKRIVDAGKKRRIPMGGDKQ